MTENFEWPKEIQTKRGIWIYCEFRDRLYDHHGYGLNPSNDSTIRVIYCGALNEVNIIGFPGIGFEAIKVKDCRLVSRTSGTGRKVCYNKTPFIDSTSESLYMLPEPIKKCLSSAFDNKGKLKKLTSDEIAEIQGNSFLEAFGNPCFSGYVDA